MFFFFNDPKKIENFNDFYRVKFEKIYTCLKKKQKKKNNKLFNC